MQSHEAFAMAQQIIDHYPRLTVVAVGHFVGPPEIRPDTPWAISVAIDGTDRCTIIRGREQLLGYATPAAKESRSKARPKPKRKPQSEPATGLLF